MNTSKRKRHRANYAAGKRLEIVIGLLFGVALLSLSPTRIFADAQESVSICKRFDGSGRRLPELVFNGNAEQDSYASSLEDAEERNLRRVKDDARRLPESVIKGTASSTVDTEERLLRRGKKTTRQRGGGGGGGTKKRTGGGNQQQHHRGANKRKANRKRTTRNRKKRTTKKNPNAGRGVDNRGNSNYKKNYNQAGGNPNPNQPKLPQEKKGQGNKPNRGYWPNFDDEICVRNAYYPNYMKTDTEFYFASTSDECCRLHFKGYVKGCMVESTYYEKTWGSDPFVKNHGGGGSWGNDGWQGGRGGVWSSHHSPGWQAPPGNWGGGSSGRAGKSNWRGGGGGKAGKNNWSGGSGGKPGSGRWGGGGWAAPKVDWMGPPQAKCTYWVGNEKWVGASDCIPTYVPTCEFREEWLQYI